MSINVSKKRMIPLFPPSYLKHKRRSNSQFSSRIIQLPSQLNTTEHVTKSRLQVSILLQTLRIGFDIHLSSTLSHWKDANTPDGIGHPSHQWNLRLSSYPMPLTTIFYAPTKFPSGFYRLYKHFCGHFIISEPML